MSALCRPHHGYRMESRTSRRINLNNGKEWNSLENYFLMIFTHFYFEHSRTCFFSFFLFFLLSLSPQKLIFFCQNGDGCRFINSFSTCLTNTYSVRTRGIADKREYSVLVHVTFISLREISI